MSVGQIKVTFEPHGRSVSVLPGTKALEAAAQAGFTVDTPCGGAGSCGKCRIRMMSGCSEPSEMERRIFDEEQLQDGWRLACQTSLSRGAVIAVPETSLFGSHHQILVTSDTKRFDSVQPSIRKVYVELPPPSLADDAPDLLRMEAALGPFRADAALVRAISGLLRANGFKGTAVLSDHNLIDFEAGDTTASSYGVAFDIGTTTVVGTLLDLHSGAECAIVSRMNPQVGFGDDVLSRISHAGGSAEGLADLRDAVVGEVNAMLASLCSSAGVAREQVYEAVFSGNTTMQHLLCGIDPMQLGQAPFAPVFARGLLLAASELGIAIHPRGAAYVFPVIGGFVGGDTVAGMLATQLISGEGPTLMVDIGTNGEIVLAHNGAIQAASTAAGPAFEGARISCGMRATRGAIEKVIVDGDVRCSVIDDAPPVGLCGSGLIDLVAQLLDAGIVLSDGRLLPPEALPEQIPEGVRRRVRRNAADEVEFVLAEDEARAVTLNQRDVRELQLATGAIRAGIAILLRNAGLEVSDLRQVLIAGGFGSFIRRSHAQRVGLLPHELDHRRIRYVGNTSLSGARWALLSTGSREEAEGLARRAHHVELGNDMDFALEFAMAMTFPDSVA